MEKLNREQLKNIKGGLQDLPPGCYCMFIRPNEPMGGIDPDCYAGSNPELYCQSTDYLLVCC